MLKGIPSILSPELLKVLAEMGHGEELVIGDLNFPAQSMGQRCIRCDGHRGAELLDGCCLLICGGDSDDAEAVKTAIIEQAQTICREGIDPAYFLRMKRSAYGRRIRDLDSFDSLCLRRAISCFYGDDYYGFPEKFDGISQQDVLEFLGRAVTEERCCLSVIDPIQKQGGN